MKKKIPVTSYRIQLNRNFCFDKAIEILPYLRRLGIEMVYTCPYFERVSGSENPYLLTSPLKIAKELGGEEKFEEFCKQCRRFSILHMMDIVPNHMAADPQNPWWRDVIEKKQESEFASFFDIDWEGGNGELIGPGCIDIHQKINYRRFFDICEMVGLNMEDRTLYELYFSKIHDYVDKGYIQGFRVDHIDGLKDPKEFLFNIHIDFPKLYIALEKIVQDGEHIRSDMLCDGTVGYEMLFLIDQVLLDGSGKETFTKLFNKYKDEEPDLSQIKISYLNTYLASEVSRFTRLFNVDREELLLFLSNFPVYRTFVDRQRVTKEDKKAIDYAASFTKGDFFKQEIYKQEHREALMMLQQILPAVFAKGFEDTFNYRYVTLASLNEVGGDPLQFSISNEKFHKRMIDIYRHLPNTMHTLSTHDTKRSLDARMRLHILAEISVEFNEHLTSWIGMVPPFESSFVMFFFFQNLIAISSENIISRMSDYMIKAMREGKFYTDHLKPNIEFEARLKEWVFFVLCDKAFLKVFNPFKEKVAEAALLKSMSAIVLQSGLFGVMDIYQGEEMENANLVDPDNRRDIDFTARKKALTDHSCLKMDVLKTCLHLRKKHKALVQKGSYVPIATKDHQIGYKRVYENRELVVIVNKHHFGKKGKRLITYKDMKSMFPSDLPFFVSIVE